MKTTFALFCASLAIVARADGMSPIGKVMQMIADLQAKVIGEGEETQKIYAKFSEWCEDRSKELHFEIKTGKANVKQLTATIDDETQKINAFETKIDELSAAIATDEADLKAATKIREDENADFVANEKELLSVIDMLQRALVILEKHGASMLQVKDAGNLALAFGSLVQAAGFNSQDASKLTALVQSSQESDDMGAPDAATYEGHSGGILETLQGILDKAENQLDEARKEETGSVNNFKMLKQSLTDAIKYANKDMAAAKKSKAASAEAKSVADGELGSTTKDLNEDEAGLEELHRDCMTKAEEFEAETKSRDEELAALAKAKAIIAETTGGAADQSYGLNQVSFLQTRLSSRADLSNFEVARFVRDLARKQNAPALAQLASRISYAVRAGNGNRDDVFAKVKGLIADMLEKLEKEASEDAAHKAYCDKELGETQAKQDDKNGEIEKLSTKIEEMSSRSAQLKEEVATLENELSALAKSQAEMDRVRGEEKAVFDKDSAEMAKGLKGVQLALKVLRDYYAKGDAAHSTSDGASSGIIGLLEVCESDFSKGLAEMTADEENSVAEHERLTKENELEKTTKEADVKFKNKESTQLDKDVAETKSDRSGVETELAAVMEYRQKLDAECVEKAETYEERKSRREAELAGLKEALNILENETAFIQKSTRRVTRHAFLQAKP